MNKKLIQRIFILFLLFIIAFIVFADEKISGFVIKNVYSACKPGETITCPNGFVAICEGQTLKCVMKKPIGCWDSCKTGECPADLDCNGRCVNPKCPGKSNCECGGEHEDTSKCDFIKIYDAQGNQIQPDQIQPSIIYTITTNGKDANAAQMRATVNDAVGSWQESISKNNKGEYIFDAAFATNINYELETEIKAYDKWWPGANCKIAFKIGVAAPGLVCNSLSRSPVDNINVGDQVSFACDGTPTNTTINHYEFQISSNGGTSYTTLDNNNTTGSVAYTISDPGNYVVQCRVCSSADGSKCTTWGQAGGWTP